VSVWGETVVLKLTQDSHRYANAAFSLFADNFTLCQNSYAFIKEKVKRIRHRENCLSKYHCPSPEPMKKVVWGSVDH
jgi:hypothetical protein